VARNDRVARGVTRAVIVGPLPPPVGGVSSHVYRSAEMLAATGARCTVLDAYPAEGKAVPRAVDYVLFSGRARWVLTAIALRRHTRLEDCTVHLHFSRFAGRLLFVALLGVRRGQMCVLTVHNGDQMTAWRRASRVRRAAGRLALTRVSYIETLSDAQHTFFRALGVPDARIRPAPEVLSLNLVPDETALPNELQRLTAFEDGGDVSLLVTSGYPRRTYGFELSLALLDAVSARFSSHLVVCLYGEGDDSRYERELREKLAAHPRVTVVGGMPPQAFLALLARASLYLRPSTEDSRGLAVVDALDVGTPSVASDVCGRDPRARTYPVTDHAAFFETATAILESGRATRRRISGLTRPGAGT
jgi:glycosyltransferase involved in cell wall biosynthesis